MLSTLSGLLKDNWEWRKQILNLAVFDLVKKSRGSALSWAWLLIKPAVYIFCFWFALDIGLRGGSTVGEGMPPYFLWLCAGLVPWFLMQEELGEGINVFSRYAYLVNKIKFPIGSIPTFTTLALLIIQLVLQVFLLFLYCLYGQPVGPHLLQIPVLIALMVVFWTMASLLFSTVSAISRDFVNFMKAMSTPIFWLSGILFNIDKIPIDWIHTVLLFNPVTFFVYSFRTVLYDGAWLWTRPLELACFSGVFMVTLVATLHVVKRFGREVPDVL